MPGATRVCMIGEAKVGRGNDLLQATLGSCVGIALLWRAQNRCALAHCLLAVAPRKSLEISARYVTQAVPSLLALMKVPATSYGELEAIVVGGASMLNVVERGSGEGVGSQNGATALRILSEMGIRIVHTEIGGDSGRQLVVDCATFEYSVRTFEKGIAA